MTDRKSLLNRLKKVTQDRYEPKSLEKGFRIRLKNLELVCEIAAAPGKPDDSDNVRLFLNPIPCGPECSDSCGCCYSWFRERTDNDSPLAFMVSKKSKLAAHDSEGQLTSLLSELQSSTGNGNGHAAEVNHD